MSSRSIVLLLRVILSKGSIDVLLREGYRASQIAMLIEEAKEKGYLKNNIAELVVSDSGHRLVLEYLDSTNTKGIERWVLPKTENHTQKHSKYDIFIPRMH